MLLRRRVRKYIMLYTCLLYMATLLLMLKQLTETENEIDVNGFNIHFRQSGKRMPCLHAWISNSSNFTNDNNAIDVNKKDGYKENVKKRVVSEMRNKVTSEAIDSIVSNHTLRRWNKGHPFMFLHIGKNGGTSFDKVMRPIISKLGGRYIGNRHFDWSYTETIKNPDVVVLLRDPVSRSVSHFHYSRKKRIFKMASSSLTEYLHNPQDMLESRDVWQDGQASVMWLTGTHVANWVRIKPHLIPEREIKSLDHKTILTKAAERLNQTLWFGLLIRIDRLKCCKRRLDTAKRLIYRNQISILILK